jgi:chromosome segregation protein
MRIKQLELIGFKSFVHRTVLSFPPGITAIVGPNGCGKSNIVDAIRWVLGEQSPKHLRGESMEDVIFNGNEHAAPLGMAQVSLTFSNDPAERRVQDPDLDVSTIPSHFRDLPEVMVTRRYLRSGESEYFINKTPCRLKDITELFLGTGVGSKAYAIIEQGRVEQLINAKPEDRRLFIEEAAGTTLYRSRRLSAERKMERTRENLLRVNDVLREIDRQVQYLKRMARKAEQYRELQTHIRELDLTLSHAQWRRLVAAVSELEAELERHRAAERAVVVQLGEQDEERGRKLRAQTAAEEELARQREIAAVLESECQSLRERITLLGSEVSERERRIGRLEADAAALAAQRQHIEQSAAQLESERGLGAQRLRRDQEDLAQREEEVGAARDGLARATAEVEAAKSALLGLVAREAEARNSAAAHAQRRDEAQRRLQKLAAEHAEAGARLAALDAALLARRAEASRLRERLRAAEGEKERCAERVRRLAEQRRGLERQVADERERLVQLRSRHESLRAVQQSYEGYQRGVRSILLDAERREGVMGVVADVIGVPQQHERALAAALGDRLQYVIVQAEEVGRGAVALLRDQDSGRGSFIPLRPRRVPMNGNGAASLNGNTSRLLDLVQVDEPYRQVAETLLGDVVVVPDLDAGLALWRKNGVHVTMVTPEGDVIDATGVITGGSERSAEEDLVARRRVVGEIASAVAQAEERLRCVLSEWQAIEREGLEHERLLEGLDRDVHSLTLELVGAEKDLERLEGERPRWLDRLEVARFESAAAASDSADSVEQLQRCSQELAALEGQRAGLDSDLHAAQQRAAATSTRLDELNHAVTSLRVGVAERRQQDDAAAAALARLQAQLADVDGRRTAMAAEAQETAREYADRRAALADAEARRTTGEAQRQAMESQIAAARAVLDSAMGSVAAQERLVRDLRERLDALRVQCSQVEVAIAEKRLRAEHVAQSTREKYGTDLTDQAPVELSEAEADALARLDALRDKLARIGEVNVGAIDELRDLEERARFLRTQQEDLERSLADLERTIHRLNRASRTRFAETFAAANEKFQAVLPRLFRGGEARLVLTDEHNLLETGVDIVVRPPGKRLDTVTLLSGGEKALVAVSLIFSLFMINPTPFCFLDEVDAPLDDANIGRFTDLVRDVSQHSQFIVITHNKRTMQAADVLYGVTMEEPGVSKVISVAMH